MEAFDPIRDKFKGTLVGCAVGDALGAPVEGMPPETIKEQFGVVTDYLDARFGRGRVTDDTQMTVALVQSIVETGYFHGVPAAKRFGKFMEYSDKGIKEARGVGMTSATAARRLYQGVSLDESGLPSAGCGAAMRASPIGLRYYHNLDYLKSSAIGQAVLSHTDPEAVAGSVAVAYAVARGINDMGNLSEARFVRETADFVSPVDKGMAEKIAGLADLLDSDPDEGFRYTGNGGYVMETVPGALFAFLRSPYDFDRTVVTAVNAGGDTDSLGAIAGAICGAFNGEEGIPPRFKEDLEGREYLEVLARRLFTLTPAGRPTDRPDD